jgi:glucuronate isomerase
VEGWGVVTAIALHRDRALPADPAVRAVARRLHAATAQLPLVCLHGHVDVALLAEDQPFADPASLLVTPDHYVTRMIASQGVDLDQLGVPDLVAGAPPPDPREVWRLFCAHWHLFRGTPSRYWLEHELVEVLDVPVTPSAETADELFDAITARLAEPGFRPRALLDRFGIQVLATTDASTADLGAHARLAEEIGPGRVVPTFRPDAVVHLDAPGWTREVARLGQVAGVDTGDYAGYVEAIRLRRRAFAEAGAVASDHGHATAGTALLPAEEAARLYRDALAGDVSPEGSRAFDGHLLHVMAEMSCEDGLVMQLHPGVLRDHDPEVLRRFGPDRGYDIPVATEFTHALRPLLERFGRDPRFRLILFTVDETAYSRELAPIAGAYPAVRLGAPWWFLDSVHGMRRFRELVSETAGFYNTSGFVDDTRAFLSIPARHDLARRIDAGYLAGLVAEHRLDEDEAHEVAVDLAVQIPLDSYARRVS